MANRLDPERRVSRGMVAKLYGQASLTYQTILSNQ